MAKQSITSTEAKKLLGISHVTLLKWSKNQRKFPELKYELKKFAGLSWKFYSRDMVMNLKKRMKKKPKNGLPLVKEPKITKSSR